tara:strand:- start:127 stop:2982 length:2856 start_codon:yes stop_codon:yes gene_type:complete
MESKLIDIPNNKLDEIINKNIEKSDKILIVVSFVFEKGLGLILDKLKNFHKPSNITIITSNYLKSTEPKALRKLLDLKSLGSKLYLFDSLRSGENFHIKSYYFENEKYDFYSCIIGSSNISFSAFKLSHELNIETRSKKIALEYKDKINNLLSNPHLLELTEDVIHEYEKVYEENKNLIRKFEDEDSNEITIIPFKKPNIIQIDALEILNSNRELGVKKGLVVMATGLGKTILSALDALAYKPKRLLFIAHREEILKQSLETFEKFIPNKSCGFYQGEKKEIDKDYLFASIQTIGRKLELEKFNKDSFDYIIIDEFHHAGAKSYKNLIEYFKPKFLLGLTATPNRSDNIDILQFLGNNLIYRKDLIDGINANLLSNFEYHGINDKHVDYTKITWRGKKFDEEELNEKLNTIKRAEYIFSNWSGLKLTRTLAFCASIKQSDFMAEYFSKRNIKAVSVHSKSKINRSDAISKLKTKEIDIIFSVDLFNEGIDIPAVDTILMIRPTESKIIFLQQFGRGLRKAEGKKIVRVIDFIGNHKSFLEKPSAILGFDLNHHNIREFIKDYKAGKLIIPKESRVLFDAESIEFMEQLAKTKIDVAKLYNVYKDENNGRPSASEFYQFIDKISNLKLQYGSWFDFIKEMNDLTKEELDCFIKNKNFFKDLEKTKMTKSFKMVVLDLLCKNDFKSYDLTTLSKDSFNYLRETTNLWNEIPLEFKKDSLTKNEEQKWEKYWFKNPIKALLDSSSKFYEVVNNKLITIFDKPSNIKAFKSLSKEIINYRFTSYKISFDLSYVAPGDINKPFQNQIGKAFSKTDVPKLFKFKGDASSEGYYKMFGHARPPNVPHQFIFITLIKASMAAEHRYHDYFKSEKIFHWQSRKETIQENGAGLAVIDHKKNNENIHLFVRKMSSINGRTLPFTYCGKINFKSVNGNAPINVDFELEHTLNNELKQEFLRL